MLKFIVQGGNSLQGEVQISGSKNAALPIICASLLTKEKTVLDNVPDIADVRSMIKIIEFYGAKVSFKNNTLQIEPSHLENLEPPENLIKKMRASVLLAGALLGRLKEVKMAFPGGCVLGKRSLHSHTYGFSKLGVDIVNDETCLHLKAEKIKGQRIILPERSVTATENIIMAATLAEGVTDLRLAATEPHVQDLCLFLNKMGAKIEGIGTSSLKITGVKELKGVRYAVTGDYLEAGTFAISAVATQGHVMINGIDPNQLDSLWQKFEEIGANFKLHKNSVEILPVKELRATKMLQTGVYPSFPTDLQAPFTVLLTQANGVSKVFETLFEGRLNYLFELEQMGAHVEYLNPHQALIIGKTPLKGMPISSCDIRAGASMVVASLIAKGTTEVNNIRYIDRGYQGLDEKLVKLGAQIKRVSQD
jgi:UDP-N-acetylglucosamine 1-carboxyvinyltransferase